MSYIRLNHDSETFEEAIKYFKERSVQMFLDNFELKSIKSCDGYALAVYNRNEKEYQSIFIYKNSRGQNIFKKALEDITNPNIITSTDCNIIPYLRKHKIKYSVCLGFTDTLEYQLISELYGVDTASRSQMPFMNHIDEGLAILHWIGASKESMKGYCLHPIYQSDELLIKYGTKDMRSKNIFGIDANVITNAVEYRHVANNYLSKRVIGYLGEIGLSPLKDVNDMLIADKIQNRKDFELYHEGIHKRSDILAQYFRNWLERLDISEETYNEYKNRLMLNEVEIL